MKKAMAIRSPSPQIEEFNRRGREGQKLWRAWRACVREVEAARDAGETAKALVLLKRCDGATRKLQEFLDHPGGRRR